MSYLLIDTSTDICHLTIVKNGQMIEHTWEAGRTLAKNILKYIDEAMAAADVNYGDLAGVGAFRGPGSFTGLRIGITVANTVASAKSIAIVGAMGDDWQRQLIDRLDQGEDDFVVLPEYGRGARITKPRK